LSALTDLGVSAFNAADVERDIVRQAIVIEDDTDVAIVDASEPVGACIVIRFDCDHRVR